MSSRLSVARWPRRPGCPWSSGCRRLGRDDDHVGAGVTGAAVGEPRFAHRLNRAVGEARADVAGIAATTCRPGLTGEVGVLAGSAAWPCSGMNRVVAWLPERYRVSEAAARGGGAQCRTGLWSHRSPAGSLRPRRRGRPPRPRPPGTPARPSPPPPTWPPSSAASSSPPDLRHLALTSQPPKKSASSAWPGKASQHNSESRVAYEAADVVGFALVENGHHIYAEAASGEGDSDAVGVSHDLICRKRRVRLNDPVAQPQHQGRVSSGACSALTYTARSRSLTLRSAVPFATDPACSD
jgi:hypothetical protein